MVDYLDCRETKFAVWCLGCVGQLSVRSTWERGPQPGENHVRHRPHQHGRIRLTRSTRLHGRRPAGFLRWKFKPAKIFMGDGGAMFLGFLMATLGLKLRLENANHLAAWLTPILILGVTIFDTTLVTISRSRRGLLPFAAPGKDHAAHRLSNLGLGQRGAVLTLYLLGATGGGAALFVSYLSTRGALVLGTVVLAIILLGVAYLEHAPYERQEPKAS